MIKRGTGMAGLLAAFAILVLLVILAGCGPEPTPLAPTPVPSPTDQPTSTATPTASPSSTATPSPTVVPLLSRINPLRSNPLAQIPTLELTGTLNTLISGTYCTPAWRASTFPATLAIPVQPVNGDLLLEWNSSATSDYIVAPGAPTYGIPANYTIATSADSTDGRNGTWHEVVNVTANKARTRAHRFPFAGARWVRMTVTSAIPGPLGNTFQIDQIELHDASSGTDDTIFFLGDSITQASFTRCAANQPSFAALVHQATPTRFPAMIDGGVSGVNSSYGVSVIQDWLVLNPDFYVWAIGYGTNDAWEKVPPETFESNLQFIVDRIEAAHRVPVIARIPFALKGPDDTDIQALNEAVDRVTARNGLPTGPDLYSWFSAHPEELGPDGTHPSEAGTRSINRLWFEALRPLYEKSP